jgi:hypothetical protein
MFLQFQSQLQSLMNAVPNLSSVMATQYFDYLPSAGIIPLAGTGGSPGFTYPVFFNQLAYHPPIFVLSSRVDSIVRTALPYPPVNLQKNEAIWLYQPVQGMNSLPYLVFTNINVPFQGEARFDVTSWNYGNFT